MKFASLFFSVTLPLYILDQLTKFWVVANFPEPWDEAKTQVAIPGVLNFVRVHNQGVAFGFGNGSVWAPLVFLIVPFIAMTAITLGWRKNFFQGLWGKVAAGLLLSGVLGNLTDRLVQGSRLSGMEGATFWERLRAGYVVDFLQANVKFPSFHFHPFSVSMEPFPVFNVADSCVCVAAALLFITGLHSDLKRKKETAQPVQ